MTIPQVGVASSAIAIFCLYQYSPVSYVNWLKVFNAIEGRQNFVGMKILITKSAKKLIRFTLILLCYSSAITQFTPTFACFFYMLISFLNVSFKQFILYAFPWSLLMSICALLVCTNYFASLIILIISFYYELRLNQLDVYVNLYLRRKRFKQINHQFIKLLSEYVDVINEVNQFNKFSSKAMFFLLLFCSSTQTFLIYNMIYVNIGLFVYSIYSLFSCNVCTVIIMIVLSSIGIAKMFQKNKRNLLKLLYVKNLAIKNRIKVKLNVII